MIEFNIIKTIKLGIEAEEHYIVELNGVVYLRAIGDGRNFVVMTATASEDNRVIKAYGDQKELIAQAVNVVRGYEDFPDDYSPVVKQDCCGREYVELFSCEYLSDLYRYSEKFFKSLLKAKNTKKYIELLMAA